jgi:limonene-1,2-epoxide hydrolase
MDGYQEFLGSMIEYTPTVTRVFSCDQNAVVVEGTVSGRNAGDKGTFAVPFAAVFELRDEKIVAERDYFDPSKMMPTG